MFASLGLLLGLLICCSFAPGFLVVRRLRWNPLEKFCAAIGVSLVLLYLAATAIHWVQPADWRIPCFTVSGLCLALTVVMFHDIRRLAAVPVVRQVLLGFLFLLVWTLAIQSIIRVYSGGGWAGDWLEHFQRSLFFLHNFPPQTPVFENYRLAARPPMMNLLGAFFLAQVGDRFELYQVCFLFLNLLVFLPCCLLAPLMALRGRWRIVPMVALFALCPLIVENVTYTITKLLTVFYLVLALRFYLTAWRKQDTTRMTAAFVFLAAAMLVHYSAGPYLVFLGLHYAVVLWRRRSRKWRELATIAITSGALLATWIGWSIVVYGAGETFSSNTTVTGTRAAEGGNLAKIGANLFDTVVPHPLRGDAPMEMFAQSSALGQFRDYIFLIDQTNVIFAIGLLGGPLLLFLLYRILRRQPDPGQRSLRTFWLGLIPFALVVGVAVHGERDAFGVAHVTLQPLIVLGLSCLAANFPAMPRWTAALVVAGCALDFAVGIAPQIWLQHLENTPQAMVFLDPFARRAAPNSSRPQPSVLSEWAWSNWFAKHQLTLSTEWLGRLDVIAKTDRSAESLQSELRRFQAHDTLYWRGWYARHGGNVTFIGDWVAASPLGGSALPMAMVAAIFVAILSALRREWQRLPVRACAAAAAPPPESRRTGKKSSRRLARAGRN